MYADQISSAGRKRSVHDRLDLLLELSAGRRRPTQAKRQQQADDKWQHDLYQDDEEPASTSVDPRDLRLKLQKKSSQQGYAGQRGSGVRDLRELLSGTMHPQPLSIDHPKAKPTSALVKLKKPEPADVMLAPQSKKVSKPTSSNKTSQPKGKTLVDSFLRSLGLEKYSITFQAEEVDMAALRHMTDDDLKAMGIPMGPRKKIILALESGA